MKDLASLSDAELMAMYKTAKDPFEGALQSEGVSGPIADIARSIYQQESNSGKNAKTSNAGAVGGMQIIPATFKSVADKDWDINDPTQNARAGIRYVKQLYEQAGGDPALTAAGYYGGPGGLEKARRGVAVSDPRNPNAPNTLQYGQQVAARLPKEKGAIQRGVDAMIPSANAGELPKNPLEGMSDDELLAAYKKLKPAEVEAPKGKSIAETVYQGLNKLTPMGAVLNMAGSGNPVQDAKDVAGGAVRGAGSIGATIAAPVDIASDALAGKGLTLESNRQRRADMDAALTDMGVDTKSNLYKGAKLGTEIAGTAGTGNVLGNVARVAGASPKAVSAFQTGGMSLGGAPAKTIVEGAGNLALRAGAGAATGGAAAGLVNPDDAKTGAVIGGAIPVVTKAAGTVGRAVGRGLAGNGMSDEVRALAQRAKELGIDIPADRLVDSKPLNAIASSLDYIPFSGRTATMNKMEDQLNRAVSRTFGQDSSNVTQALRQAQGKLGGEFDRVLQNNTVKVDNQFLTDLADAASQAGKELGSDGARIISNQVDEIMAKAGGNGQIDGQAAYNIKKTLDRIANRNTPEAFYARDLKQKLMEALNRSLGQQEAAAFAKTRQQYGNMLAMEKIAQNGAEGGVSIARLANMKNINNPELQELADISSQFLKSREGQHGAAQRTVMGLGGLMAGGATGTLPALAGGVAAGRGTNMLLNSNLTRNALMGQPGNKLLQFANEPDLAQMFYRAAPVAVSDR